MFKKKLLFVIIMLLIVSIGYAQNITNTLGANGSYIIKNALTTFLTLMESNGCIGIGTNSFDATNPEKLLIDCGTTTSVNAIYAKGIINSYFQFNIRNNSTGTQSSSDIVATANNGTETTNFMNMGINGSGYVYQAGNPIETGAANDCYLLGSGNNLYIVNNNATKDMLFLTGGTASTNERMRILSSGNIGIGTNAPASLFSVGSSSQFQVNSTGNIVKINNVVTSWPSSQGAANTYLKNNGSGTLTWSTVSGTVPSLTAGSVVFCNSSGANLSQDNSNFFWDVSNKRLAIGSKTFDATNPEKLKVDAGVTTSKNVISGYGSINSYLQLNVKNSSSGSSASTDLVATNDVGSETKGFIDMGINSSTYNDAAFTIGGKNDAYLYCIGNDGGTPVGGNLTIGTSSASTVIKFHTGGTLEANERMRIDASGNVGIGMTPDDKFTVFNGTTYGRYTTGGWTHSSDSRLKHDVVTLSGSLEKILKLRGVSFKFNNDPDDKTQIGVIAQEIEKVIPEVVVTSEDGYKSVAYANLTAILIEGVKEQQSDIEILKSENKELKAGLTSIEQKLIHMNTQPAGMNPNILMWVMISFIGMGLIIVILKKCHTK